MKERFMTEVLGKMQHLDKDDRDYLRNVLAITMNNYDICLAKNEIVEWNGDRNYELLKLFLVSKRVEGCSEKTTNYYKTIMTNFLDKINLPVEQIEANNIRFYLANREVVDRVAKVTLNNERRVLSSFFTWLLQEEYITKNPILKVKTIKTEKRRKKAFTEVELEKLRNACATKRERCIVEVLLSTGCRVGGLTGMRLSNISGESVSIIEKGDKQRDVYFNARAKVSLEEYLKERTDSIDYVIVSKRTNRPLSESSVESIVKKIGQRAGIANCHPHRFRRTFATLSLKHGMPLEELKEIMGHENIETTMMYIDNEEILAMNHMKYSY